MKRASWLIGCCLALGCSAASPDTTGSGGTTGSLGGAGMASGGSTTTAGSGAGVGGSGTSGGGGVGGAALTTGGSGGSSAGGTVAGGSGGAAGATGGGGSSGSGGGSGSGCVPDPNGALMVNGDAVHDAKTCLDWMKTTKTGVNYAAAEMYCADATTGGFDDWRIPDASEFASIVTRCGKYTPEGPIDTSIFDLQGDGYWTTTPAGEPNKVCAVGMLNAGGYYHYGTAGPQVVRCVRGTGTVKMVKDCTMAMGCSNW
ncbi:MAG TPA: DUF1566 domain-containing protein [Polyangiaceae bacterium]|nr:DUF1566 domain-containing protein [Polyangiaceae bacterium]